MSTFSQQYQFQEQPQFFDPRAFGYGQYDVLRPKTPTDSLLNHTGLSPGPLFTTPPLSRNPSQQPELPQDQLPEHMFWEDHGSLSNSPTSVRTPDPDSFEVEMLDSTLRSYYQSGNTMSTQAPQDAIPVMDTGMFLTPQGTISDQAIQAAFNATMAEAQQYQQQFNMQAYQEQQQQHQLQLQLQQQQQQQHQHHMLAIQPPHNFFDQSYTTQPPRRGPWTGQGPSRSSMVPRSGHVVFDPSTDHVNYSEFLHDVDSWTMNSTDPSYLVSPSEPMAPPLDNIFSMATQPYVQYPLVPVPYPQMQAQSPVEMRITGASPTPDAQNFVNFNASSTLFTENYITGYQLPPSSPGTSSIDQYPHSPLQQALSPQASAPSPSSSDGRVSSYQHSDPGVMITQFSIQQPNYSALQSENSLQVNFPAQGSIPETTFDASPEPESSRNGTRQLNKSGGRTLGTHLEPTVAKAAHDMRKIVACWHCVLQRDKCGPGDTCERCLKRSQRPNADCGLGCSRIKLIDLSDSFLPILVTQMHENKHLETFVTQHIQQWGNVEMTVMMTCGQHHMPRFPVKVYEFVPRGNALLVQIQYRTDPVTHERIAIEKQSPALGMVLINHSDEKRYERYINEIVEHHLDAFGEICWMEDDNDFQQRLFKLMTRVKPKSDDEANLFRDVYRLIVVTFIMSHTLTIAEETKVSTLSRMHSYGGGNSYVQNYTSPRMTNRQLKYFFSRLQRSIQNSLLNRLQQMFKSSKGCDKWLAAFLAVVGMCMALEDQQKTVHLVMATRSATEGLDPRAAQEQADVACREIDTRIHFIQQIFRWKYNRKCNPLVNPDHAWDQEVGFGDATSVSFVRQVAQLVKENSDYLQQRRVVSISPANQGQYTARLVGGFLLSFWMP
ncbi:hypothetical protein P153DRAFT_110128 [Dothidotthia symphoricarpi CBS 119687]|uniref:Uncharacterized protein n=1 Tax=Dothidotthia symphoricarpi CBS 119687 TaxID=1392245 RepID=A0A6A6ATP8_9PLEO|nr:uncharacterized protein P153DRAFT_110128 [Dothidotthia symphoricarpi CBS 119687]KAF2134334.1 hypothetical protein P153DRAFT_110128 [Dothidotthia symphoricarpi CBS 119687]